MRCRNHGQVVECCAYVTGTEWVTGSSDGALALWSQLKKKPVAVVRGAHHAGPVAASADSSAQRSTVSTSDEAFAGAPPGNVLCNESALIVAPFPTLST